MSVHSRGLLFLSFFFVVSFCNADQQTFKVVGVGECVDCKENHFNENNAISGLHVTIDCKSETSGIKRLGAAKLDEQGKFTLQLPQEAVEQASQKLKEECYAQLHNAADVPCPAHGGLETTKIAFKSHENGKFIFSPAKPLQFSTSLCTSKFLWKKKFPKLPFPPVPIYEPKPKPPVAKPLPPPIPVHKPKPKPEKPILPPAPVHKPKPKPPVVKPRPPPIPVHKPKPEPKKPSKPADKPKPKLKLKPKKPSKPAHKPKLKPKKPNKPVDKPKPKPKPPVIKPLPPPIPLFPIPPIHKKPCPPLPKIPPKYFHHPKIGYFPPPAIPHP